MESPPLPAKVRTLDIEGQCVRCIETDGRRVWLCECPSFKERATRHPEGFCAHTAVAIMRGIHDGSNRDSMTAGYRISLAQNANIHGDAIGDYPWPLRITPQ